MGDLKDLVGPEEADGVGPRLGAAPEGVDADLLLLPGPGNAVASIDRLPLVPGSTASRRSLAVPLGASAFWLWWVSTISMSKSSKVPATSSKARRNTAMPRE